MLKSHLQGEVSIATKVILKQNQFPRAILSLQFKHSYSSNGSSLVHQSSFLACFILGNMAFYHFYEQKSLHIQQLCEDKTRAQIDQETVKNFIGCADLRNIIPVKSSYVHFGGYGQHILSCCFICIMSNRGIHMIEVVLPIFADAIIRRNIYLLLLTRIQYHFSPRFFNFSFFNVMAYSQQILKASLPS